MAYSTLLAAIAPTDDPAAQSSPARVVSGRPCFLVGTPAKDLGGWCSCAMRAEGSQALISCRQDFPLDNSGFSAWAADGCSGYAGDCSSLSNVQLDSLHAAFMQKLGLPNTSKSALRRDQLFGMWRAVG